MPAAPIFSALHITYAPEVHIHSRKIISDIHTLPLAISDLKWLPVKSGNILANGQNVNTVIELSLDNSQSCFEFHPGDTIGIIPENDETEVEWLLQRLNVSALGSNVYTLRWIEAIAKKKETFPSHIPTVGSLREVFTYFVDIRRVLNKAIINALCDFTRNNCERMMMERLCKEKDLYSQEILQNNVSISRFLQRFPSCHPHVTLLLQHLPRLMPRPYSVCNSQKVDKNTLKICFSVIELPDTMKGVTTGWLERVVKREPNNVPIVKGKGIQVEGICSDLDRVCLNQDVCERPIGIPAYLRRSTFRLPIDPKVPVVLIATGTGIAPFIGYLQERQMLMKMYPNREFGFTQLYYGCRYFNKDFLYKVQLDAFLKTGALTKMTATQSRENKNGCKYVQDSMEFEQMNLVYLLLHSPTIFYVCGSNIMTKNVETFYCNSIEIFKKTTEASAKNIMKDLKRQNKYNQDIWL
ncbi:methionine synthase reductase isoform X2 [Arctopsyche grandis]|uniref:methionine synthase reductase isoform X2 n=1 Tax=Arctopsyche grandis TaxID=121162 RepID=UPI00406D94D7